MPHFMLKILNLYLVYPVTRSPWNSSQHSISLSLSDPLAGCRKELYGREKEGLLFH